MQQPMNQQRAQTRRRTLLEFARLPRRGLDRNHDVAERNWRSVFRLAARERFQLSLAFELREREYVGRLILRPEIAIEPANRAVAHHH